MNDFEFTEEFDEEKLTDIPYDPDGEVPDLSEEQVRDALTGGYVKAEKLLGDEDKMERFLQRLEKKLKLIPFAGEKLSQIPALVSLVRAYIRKEYTDVPLGAIIAAVSALIYFVSPIDILPDSIPFLGYFDDVAVIGLCWKLIESDVKEYTVWRKENNKVLVEDDEGFSDDM